MTVLDWLFYGFGALVLGVASIALLIASLSGRGGYQPTESMTGWPYTPPGHHRDEHGALRKDESQ